MGGLFDVEKQKGGKYTAISLGVQSSLPKSPMPVVITRSLFKKVIATAVFITFLTVFFTFQDSFYRLGRPVWSGSVVGSGKVIPIFSPGEPTAFFNESKNPLFENIELAFGPWKASIPESVTVGETFELELECIHQEEKYCPPAYYVQFYGPTTMPIPITGFRQISKRIVKANMTLNEPGNYNVYAWPNDPQCQQWQSEEIPPPQQVYRQAVQGCPHKLQVIGISDGAGNGAVRVDTHRKCENYEEILDGRWINKNNVVPEMIRQYSFGQFHPNQSVAEQYSLENFEQSRYIYSPYDCKIPHRSILNAIEDLPSAKHFLFIGDSVARGYVCTRIFKDLFGADNLGVCEFHPESKVWEHGNKQAEWTHPNGNRTVNVTLAFPHRDINEMWPFLDSLTPKPDFVAFNMGYWIDKLDDGAYRQQFVDFFDYVDRNWSGAHVIVRSTTSVVQPVQCYEAGSHTRANSHRERAIALESAKEWAKRVKDAGKGTRVSFVDAFTISDSRPESTVDGLHWMFHAPKLDKLWSHWNITVRPAAGEAEDMLQDWMWDEFVNQRSLNTLV
ncbi:hypothetical protein RUND412_005889 [Rhizina undulata]